MNAAKQLLPLMSNSISLDDNIVDAVKRRRRPSSELLNYIKRYTHDLNASSSRENSHVNDNITFAISIFDKLQYVYNLILYFVSANLHHDAGYG